MERARVFIQSGIEGNGPAKREHASIREGKVQVCSAMGVSCTILLTKMTL